MYFNTENVSLLSDILQCSRQCGAKWNCQSASKAWIIKPETEENEKNVKLDYPVGPSVT